MFVVPSQPATPQAGPNIRRSRHTGRLPPSAQSSNPHNQLTGCCPRRALHPAISCLDAFRTPAGRARMALPWQASGNLYGRAPRLAN